MEKRVYPSKYCFRSKISVILLVLTAVVVISGLVEKKHPSDLTILPAPTATPIPLNEAFD